MADPADSGPDQVLESILAALAVPALLLGPDQRVRLGNAEARSALRSPCVGLHHIALLRQPGLLDAIAEVYADGQSRTVPFSTLDGSTDTQWSVTVTAPVLALRRNLLLTFYDVTMIGQAARMRRDFIANLSHELRTPLTAVAGFVETLRGAARDDAEARDRFLAIVEAETGRMTRLVDDLLSLSRVEENERRRPDAPVDLNELMIGVVAALAPVAQARSVTMTTDAGPDTLIVPGDSGQLRQVLSNLVENAIKYGGKNKTVMVRLRGPIAEPALRGTAAHLSVIDQGEGIAAHHIPRLTERFYRVDSHRSRDLGGTGLGLAIVKHIVGRHRGRLRIESVEGQGSTFTVVLPLQ